VIRSFQALEHRDVSLEKAYKLILEKSKMSLDEKDKEHVLRAIFAVLCWSSATIKPILNDQAIATAIKTAGQDVSKNFSVAAENCSKIYFSGELRQPLRNIFYKLRASIGSLESEGLQSDGGSSNDVLYQSSLNYSSLSTIGRVRLEWVDTLTSHLAFNPSTRTLSIFRFPSYCVINVLFNGDIKVLKECVSGYCRHFLPLPILPCLS
jgi:hypothetical protein